MFRPIARPLLLSLVAVCALMGGCATIIPQELADDQPVLGLSQKRSPATGTVLTRTEILAAVPRAVLGDTRYAQVDSRWLQKFYEDFRSELFRNGISRWDARFTCKHYAAYYTALAQATFYYQSFHSFTKADALALGTYWYIRTDGRGHALIVALTERGRIFIEPQNGHEVSLTPAEQSNAFLKVF